MASRTSCTLAELFLQYVEEKYCTDLKVKGVPLASEVRGYYSYSIRQDEHNGRDDR
jgi:hypothetical protein